LILARELSRPIRLLVAAQPTRGLDVGAMESVHELLLEQRKAMTATLLISEDLSELLALCDRIVVLFRGRVAGQCDAGSAQRSVLGRWMAGLGDTHDGQEGSGSA